MPVLNLPMDQIGRPIAEIHVAMGTSLAKGRRENGDQVPGVIPVKASVITGAGRSQVSLSIVETLGLRPVLAIDVFTASTGDAPELMDTCVVDLAFAGGRPGPMASDLRVIGSSKLAGLEVDMLPGRDLLDGCLLAHDGPNRRFSIAYDRPEVDG